MAMIPSSISWSVTHRGATDDGHSCAVDDQLVIKGEYQVCVRDASSLIKLNRSLAILLDDISAAKEVCCAF